MFNGKIDYKWLFSIAMLVYQRVAVVEDHRQEKLLFFICTVRRIGFSQFPDSNPLHFVPAEKILCSGCGGWNGGTPKSSVLRDFPFGKPSMLGYSHVIMTSRTPPCHRRKITFVVLLLMSFREISDDLCQSQKQGWPRRQIFFFEHFWNISIWSWLFASWNKLDMATPSSAETRSVARWKPRSNPWRVTTQRCSLKMGSTLWYPSKMADAYVDIDHLYGL